MNWVVFIYKVPSTPTKYRAYLWREIKKLGAIYLQDGVCVVPDSDDTHLFIGSLAEKVNEFGGQEYTFLSTTFSKEKNEEMIRQFNIARNQEYQELIPRVHRIQEYFQEEEDWEFSESQARKIREEFQKLLRQFQAIETRDYFEADAGRKLQLMINECRKQLIRHF
ncbi:Chromate resistance protein ChrB [Aneurinibacillus terranovensis]|uniref:Chromate resistance protein ChrB n=1 Tax=Aneurinibacillus terranovensis TaxID=278991 RepID=UPI0004115DFB|nr:Chromate resistance protein ChrB [Aneurinibacillus terranovensis]